MHEAENLHMSRIKIKEPAAYSFTVAVPVRITDINYGNHVGNDAVFSIIHEARMQFLAQFGFTELACAGVGLIMADAGVEFKKELFYGDEIEVLVAAENFTSIGFDLYYRIEKKADEKRITAALLKTGMICYDYQQKKITQVPALLREKLESTISS